MSKPAPAPKPARGRVSWPVIIVGLAITLPLLVVLIRGLSLDPKSMDAPLIGRQAPAFSLPSMVEGPPVTLEALRGKPAVINFFATWCVSCRQEHRTLVRGARELGQDVQFIGIVYEDTRESVGRWLDRHGGRGYPTLIDVGGKAAIAYGVYGVPETYFVDAEGIVRDKHAGPLTLPQLVASVRKL